MNIRKLNLLVEEVLKEYFDDDFQRNNNFIDFENPYEIEKLVKPNDFDSKVLATTTNPEDNIPDARILFGKYVSPILEMMPKIIQRIRIQDSSADQVLLRMPIKIKDLNIELYMNFRFDGKNIIVQIKPETYYNKNKLNPFQEVELAASNKIAGLREVGDYFRFTYKPFMNLIQNNRYTGLMKDSHSLTNFLMKTIGNFLYVLDDIQKNNLP